MGALFTVGGVWEPAAVSANTYHQPERPSWGTSSAVPSSKSETRPGVAGQSVGREPPALPLPAEHAWPAGHAVPHTPQFALSLVRSLHTPEPAGHADCPGAQPHAPALQA